MAIKSTKPLSSVSPPLPIITTPLASPITSSSTSKITSALTTKTNTDPNCQDLPGLEMQCSYFTFNNPDICYNSASYINGILYSVACKRSCNLCIGNVSKTKSTASSFSSTSSIAPIITSTTSTTKSSTITPKISYPFGKCIDIDPNCDHWSNYCNILTETPIHPCAKTCNVCSVETSFSSASPSTYVSSSSSSYASNCVDLLSFCIMWIDNCSLLDQVSPLPCMKTCKQCK